MFLTHVFLHALFVVCMVTICISEELSEVRDPARWQVLSLEVAFHTI